jgi:signal peptidase II
MIFIIVFFILSLDQLTKYFVSKNLILGQPKPIISGILNFTLVHNRGAAFGILKNQTYLFIFATIFAIVLIYLNLKNNKHRQIHAFSLALILSGALGNLIDRVFFGFVIDFLDFRVWPVFNIADSAITIGAILLGWSICFQKSAK